MASQVEGVKWVPGTSFIVDGFRFQHPACTAYFLTHAHSDHTTGLTQAFSAGGQRRASGLASTTCVAACAGGHPWCPARY
jgi:phosphoribosyl 1,2-cyclic phosphodiesterase